VDHGAAPKKGASVNPRKSINPVFQINLLTWKPPDGELRFLGLKENSAPLAGDVTLSGRVEATPS
jgi:hypothetical protein